MPPAVDEPAVRVEDVSFGYPKGHLVLNQIAMTVQQQTIYGLIGSSGCGKTTLLKCVLGLIRIKSGRIHVFGRPPGQLAGQDIGYMPQELALYPNFTIEESLKYFAGIYNMPDSETKQRIDFLQELLQLPDRRKSISKLSSGQQRRVSLAIALIHSPPLLVLDEPTVGLDPVLRTTIWNHLMTLCDDGLTIVITTHYCEEVNSANTVGFMRDGRLLAEGEPKELMSEHRTLTVDDLFLALCQLSEDSTKKKVKFKAEIEERFQFDVNQIKERSDRSTRSLKNNLKVASQPLLENKLDDHQIIFTAPSNKLNRIEHLTEGSLKIEIRNSNSSLDWNYSQIYQQKSTRSTFWSRVKSLSKKNFHRLSRNYVNLILFVLMPAIQMSIVITCVGDGAHDLPVAVYNEEGPGKMAELYLDSLNKDIIDLQHCDSFEEAIGLVEDGEAWAAIDISDRFTDAIKLRMLAVMSMDVDNETIDDSQIQVHLDMSNQRIGFRLISTFVEASDEFLKKITAHINMPIEMMKWFVDFPDPVYGLDVYQFREYYFVVPGMFVFFIFFATSGVTSTLIAEERRDRMLDRSLVAGVRPIELIISHVMIQIFVLIIQVVIMLSISLAAFDTPNQGSLFAITGILFLVGISGLFFGLTLSMIVHQPEYINVSLLSVMVAIGFLSGIFFPIENLPTPVHAVTRFLPTTIPVDAVRSIMFRGWSFERKLIRFGLLTAGLWSVGLAALTIFFTRRNIRIQ